MITANMHTPVSATADEDNGFSWVTFADNRGSTFTMFVPPHVARALADAFSAAMQKEAAE